MTSVTAFPGHVPDNPDSDEEGGNTMKERSPQRALLLAALLAITVSLIGCGQGKSAASGAAGAPKLKAVTLNLLYPDEGVKCYPGVLDATMKKLKADGYDFKLTMTSIPYDNYYDKLYLVEASAEDLDICWVHGNQMAGYIAKNLLATLNTPLKNFAPDIMANTPQYVWDGATVNGNIYAVPRVIPTAQNDWMDIIRGDLREKYGTPPITDVATYTQYLAAIKKNEPKMVGYWSGWFALARQFCPTYYFMESGVYVDLADPQLKAGNFYASAAYKQICDTVYQWVQKGYKPKDAAAINNDNTSAFTSGRLAACGSNVMWPTEQIETFSTNIPNGKMEQVFLNPKAPKYILIPIDNCSAVFNHSKKLNESVAFLNWVRHNQENYDLWSFGVKGVNYNLTADNKLTYEGIAPDNKFISMSWMWTDLRFHRYHYKMDPAYITVINNWDKDAVVSPLSGLQFDKSVYKDMMAAKNTVMQEYNAPMEGGLVTYDSKKAEMLAKHKAAGLDTIIAEIQKQIDAWVAKKKS
jgi:putative aldouronate transport system substrate-binding protein